VDKARKLYVIVGCPSRKVLENTLKMGWLMNNQVTIQDCKNMLTLYGEDL
jgi:hypothetical protein